MTPSRDSIWNSWSAVLIVLTLMGLLPGCQQIRRRSTVSQLAESRDLIFEGQRQGSRDQWEQAESQFRSAIKACPQDERAHGHLADSLWNQGKLDDALSSQLRAVELSAGEPRHRIRLGEMYLEMGQVTEALAEAEAALDLDRTSTSAWNLKSVALEQLGRRRESLACLQRSLAFDDSQHWVYERIANLYESENQPQRALATWQAYEDRFPSDEVPAEIMMRQSLALQRLGRPREAVEQLVEARRRAPDSPEVLLALADLQWQIGDRANAQLTLTHLKSTWPEHPGAAEIARRWDSSVGPTLRR